MKWHLLLALSLCHSAWADPIWHCSRNVGQPTYISEEEQSEQFSVASVSTSSEVIGVSISDLIDVYSGRHVKVGGLPLSACFMPNTKDLTNTALESLGLEPATIQALARKSSIIQSNLHLVTNEKQMAQCIAQHFPAVGYLDTPTKTNEFEPCF